MNLTKENINAKVKKDIQSNDKYVTSDHTYKCYGSVNQMSLENVV